MSVPTANVLLNVDNDFTHAQASIVDNQYRQDTTEYYIQTVDSGLLVPERTFTWGSWYRGDLVTTIPSGTVVIWHPSFGGTVSTFTWDENTLESPEWHNSTPEYAFVGQDLGPISEKYVVYTPSEGASSEGGDTDDDHRRKWLLGYI